MEERSSSFSHSRRSPYRKTIDIRSSKEQTQIPHKKHRVLQRLQRIQHIQRNTRLQRRSETIHQKLKRRCGVFTKPFHYGFKRPSRQSLLQKPLFTSNKNYEKIRSLLRPIPIRKGSRRKIYF